MGTLGGEPMNDGGNSMQCPMEGREIISFPLCDVMLCSGPPILAGLFLKLYIENGEDAWCSSVCIRCYLRSTKLLFEEDVWF